MRRLEGVGVLVTRPQAQAEPLCRLLEQHGAVPIRLPAIIIEPTASQRELAARLGDIMPSDLVVFTSANAVRYGAPLLEQRRDLTIAAIGPATRRALNLAGYRVSIVPAQGFDSEHLLAEPGLRHIPGLRVVLIKGVGGRELLAQEFAARGARVDTIEVYRRRPAAPDAGLLRRIEAQAAAGDLQIVTATSMEIATALLAISAPGLRAALERLHWVVPGGRIAAAIRSLGLAAPLIEAASPEDQEIVGALLRWPIGESGE
ncbi:MAG TPA: uroporphyrinogen-III synthase [Steroidobacteraceae bacterium]|nr:uroporphyrinogen-III synthase [Steroidobacteraceae bacterium]